MILILCLFSFLAGLIDAMVGGGGLIQLPALLILQPHLTLVNTIATNKTASFLGTTVASIKYIKNVKIDWNHLSVMLFTIFASSFSGAFLVSHIHKEEFMPFIICVLIMVLIYTLFKKDLGLYYQEKIIGKTKYYFYSALVGIVLGFYEGLIGPGTGSFLIFIFVVLFGYNFLHASANAKVVNWIASLSALCFFLYKGYVLWTIAIPLGISNMVGNYLGSHIAMKKGSGFIRIFFLFVVAALILKLGYDYL